jgi:nucleoside-diphosphate-sugar epimerase
MKRVLITGGNGFIGGNLMRFLISRRYQCWNHHRGTDLDLLLEQVRPDIIINCVAEIYDVDLMYDVNVGMTMRLIDWCRYNGSRMIQFGSSSEYGNHGYATTENHVLRPENSYAGTKAAATMLCQGMARQHQLDIVIIRLYSPYGPGEKPHRLFPKLWQAFEKNRPMKLVEGVHDFSHIDDVVVAVNLVIEHKNREPGEIINLCSGQQHTNSRVLEEFEKYYGRKGPIDFDSTVMSTPKIWCGDNSVIRNKYQWEPDFDLESGIYKFIQNAYYE